MTTHSSILAWKIPWTEEPGRPPTMGHKESDTTEQLSTRIRVKGKTKFITHSLCFDSQIPTLRIFLKGLDNFTTYMFTTL